MPVDPTTANRFYDLVKKYQNSGTEINRDEFGYSTIYDFLVNIGPYEVRRVQFELESWYFLKNDTVVVYRAKESKRYKVSIWTYSGFMHNLCQVLDE